MRLFSAVATAAVLTGAVYGQNVISAKAGLVHYSEGDVLVAGKPVEKKPALFTTMKEGETLSTTEGRAEILLGPGNTLRIAENSQVKLVNSELSDVRVHLVQGDVILEASEGVKENKTTIFHEGVAFSPKKDGIYSISTAPDLKVMVWEGEANVVSENNGQTTVVKSGKTLAVANGSPVVTKFDKEDTDALYRWAKRRSGVLALANVSSARNSDRWSSMYTSNGWSWNPYLNMFTYVPMRGIWSSPFGWSFYSPGAVMSLYRPSYGWGGGWGGGGIAAGGSWAPSYSPNHGYNTVPMRSGGPSMTSMGSGGGAPVSAAPAPSAGGGGGGARGGGGGGVGHAGGGGRGR